VESSEQRNDATVQNPPENTMKTSYQPSSVRTDNILSILVIVATIGCASFGALAQAFAPLAA
jgi:hypothetical protein